MYSPSIIFLHSLMSLFLANIMPLPLFGILGLLYEVQNRHLFAPSVLRWFSLGNQ